MGFGLRGLSLGTLLALAADAGSAFACCGQGSPAGPRPAVPLFERGPVGGARAVLRLKRVSDPGHAASLEAAFKMLPSVRRVEIDLHRRTAKVESAGDVMPQGALVEAARRVSAEVSPTTMTRIGLPDGAAKGTVPSVERLLALAPGVLDFELEVEGSAAVIRVWHEPSTTPGSLVAALGAAGVNALIPEFPAAPGRSGAKLR